MSLVKRVLVANRGAIAMRVIQAVQELGAEAVAVYSEPDETSIWVQAADAAIPLGGASPRESYLDIAKLIAAAIDSGCDAVHPGYGFLSENADFAQAVTDARMKFVGPPARAIRSMGSKAGAKAMMVAAGIPVVPGYHGDDQSLATFTREAERVGYPVLIKASAGGGGKGMRIVRAKAELDGAISAARRESQSAFGSERLLLERYLERPRHIEVQVLCDAHGHRVHLGERECSIQRRHQKILEEAPSPMVTPELRAAMGADALKAAAACDYVNAGTVEFIVAATGEYYFLEMNTRLQVEHSVTELTVGVDLVQLQLRIASGEPLPFAQSDVQQRGAAMEVRIYAEDPEAGFLPSTGTIMLLEPPNGVHLRNDLGIHEGAEVTLHYDPMLAKLTAWGDSREMARRRLHWALERYVIAGVRTNIPFLIDLLEHPSFIAGDLHTGFIAEHLDGWRAPSRALDDDALIVAAIGEQLFGSGSQSNVAASDRPDPFSPWRT